MIRVLLVRHGETEWNAEGRMQGRTDIPLSDLGRHQARLAGGLIRAQHPQQAYASTLVRTQQTLEAFNLDLDPTIWDDLSEIGFGEWEGRYGWQLKEDHPEEFNRMRAGTFVPDGAESNAEVTARMREAFFNIVRGTAQIMPTPSADLGFNVRTVVVVSHGTSLRLLLQSMGLADQQSWVPLTNAATTMIDVPLQPGPVSSTLPKAGLGDEIPHDQEAQKIAALSDEQIEESARLRLINLSPELLNSDAAETAAIG